MGRFSEYVKGFKTAHDAVGGVRGAAAKAREYGTHLSEDYKSLHGNMPGAREYMSSDAGRSTARFAMGSALNTYLDRKSKQMGKKGTIMGMAGNALFTFAHTAFQSHMNNLKHDQRIFENVAKARRGSPELEHLTHLELREISENAKKYGGKDAHHIEETANKTLADRQTRKNVEQAKGIEEKRGMLHSGKRGREAELHDDRMKRRQAIHETRMKEKDDAHKAKMARQAELRNTAGHVGAKATTENVARAKAAGSSGSVTGSKATESIKRKTKKGAVVVGEGGKEVWKSNEELKAGKKPKAKKAPGTRASGGGRRSRS